MSQQKKTVCVLGLGYIGLPTACVFADAGFQVIGVDINPEIVKKIASGQCHIEDEPDLDQVLARVVKSGRFRAQLQPVEADLYLICVPTPFREEHKSDLTYVDAAMNSVLPYLRSGSAVVLESTSPPGTTEKVIATAVKTKGLEVGRDVHVAYCPERVLPGQILRELKTNSRIVGGMTPQCAQVVAGYYREIVDGQVHETNAIIAETVKLTENSYRDVNIAFANEMSMICGHLGIDHREVIRLANQHPRVKILTPGAGVGGHCIAVDPWFLVEAAPKQSELIRTAREVNLAKTDYVIASIKAAVSDRYRRYGSFQKICLFGMTYKPNTADFRESPSVEIAHALVKELGKMAEVIVVDPYIAAASDALWAGIRVLSMDDARNLGSEALSVKLIGHRQFEDMKFSMDFSC